MHACENRTIEFSNPPIRTDFYIHPLFPRGTEGERHPLGQWRVQKWKTKRAESENFRLTKTANYIKILQNLRKCQNYLLVDAISNRAHGVRSA